MFKMRGYALPLPWSGDRGNEGTQFFYIYVSITKYFCTYFLNRIELDRVAVRFDSVP